MQLMQIRAHAVCLTFYSDKFNNGNNIGSKVNILQNCESNTLVQFANGRATNTNIIILAVSKLILNFYT